MEKIEKGILGFTITLIIIAVVIATFISPLASSFPDGLEKVAENLGFIDNATSVVSEGFFLIPDYSFSYIGSETWQGPLAGLFGVLIILILFGIVYLVYRAVIRNRKAHQKD